MNTQMFFYSVPVVLLLLLGLLLYFALSGRKRGSLAGYFAKAERLHRNGGTLVAVALLEKARNELDLGEPERDEIDFKIGDFYYENADYATAQRYFDRTMASALKRHDFDYSEQFLKVIKTYLANGEKTKARALYENLLGRRDENRTFEKLKEDADGLFQSD